MSRQTCASLRENKLSSLHNDLGHPGITRLTHYVRSKNLPYSTDDIKKIVSLCRVCSEIKPRFLKYTGTLIKATTPFERLALDFKGPLPSTNKNKYLLTIIDEYSRFPFAYACPDTSSKTIINCLKDLFSIFGMPSYIHSDRGSGFISAELRDFLNNQGVPVSHSAPYNPRGNGQIERLNGTLWQTIRLILRSKNLPITDWETVLPDALLSIRSLLCTATNATPHERMFNHTRRFSSGQMLPTWLRAGNKVYRRNPILRSKYDPLVDEVELIEPNPLYSRVRLSDGRDITTSNRNLAPTGSQIEQTPSSSSSSSPNSSPASSYSSPLGSPQEMMLRRSERIRRPPAYFIDYTR